MNILDPTAFTMGNDEKTSRNGYYWVPPIVITDTENPKRDNEKRRRGPVRRLKKQQCRARKRYRDQAHAELKWRLEELRDDLRSERNAIIDELWAKTEEYAEDIRFGARDREDEVHDEIGKSRIGRLSDKLVAELREETHASMTEICLWTRRRGDKTCKEMRDRLRNRLRISVRGAQGKNAVRNGGRTERDIEKLFAALEREKEQALRKMMDAASWAVYDMVCEVSYKFDKLDREQNQALDEMDRQLDQEVSRIERHLAKCQLEGEKRSP
jgi:hypothetical protein